MTAELDKMTMVCSYLQNGQRGERQREGGEENKRCASFTVVTHTVVAAMNICSASQDVLETAFRRTENTISSKFENMFKPTL